MDRRWLIVPLVFFAIVAVAQQVKSPTNPHLRQEFPVLLKHGLTAGESAVGTPVDASLVVATMVRGIVIPSGAHFFGQVEESTAASVDTPARIVVHFAAVRWEKRTIPVDLYLTNSYYPRPPDPAPWGTRVVNKEMLRFMENAELRPGQVELVAPARPSAAQVRLSIPSTATILTADGSTAIVSSRKKLRLDRELTYCLEGVLGEPQSASAQMR